MEAIRKVDLGALIAGRCPRCHQGAIFKPLFSRSPLAMYAECLACRLVFEREPGYFVGAMYVSYTIGVLLVLPVALFLLLVVEASVAAVLTTALIQTLLTMAVSFRYARIVWLYLDQALDPR